MNCEVCNAELTEETKCACEETTCKNCCSCESGCEGCGKA